MRPKQNHEGKTFGTLLVGTRLESEGHARYKFTCLICNYSGVRDARHLSRGCISCRSAAVITGLQKRVRVATVAECHDITTLQILKYFRMYPEDENTTELLRVRFYLDGKRVRVTEDEAYVHVSQPAHKGEPVHFSFLKVEQELDANQSWTLPARKKPVNLVLDPATQEPLADPLAFHYSMPEAPEPQPLPKDVVHEPRPEFQAPDGWLKLERPSDATWLGAEASAKPTPPYLLDWTDTHNEGSYRTVHTNGEVYAVFTPAQPRHVNQVWDETDLVESAPVKALPALDDTDDEEREILAAMQAKRLAQQNLKPLTPEERFQKLMGNTPT